MSEDALPPLPDPPTTTVEHNRLKQMRYEMSRRQWRDDHPLATADSSKRSE